MHAAANKKEKSLPPQSSEARVRSEAREERAKDGAEAMIEYQANGRAVREKMAELKALRLAKVKEEAEKERELAAQPKSARAKSKGVKARRAKPA